MRFSKDFVQIAEFHHWNTYSKGTEPELMVINLADQLAHLIGFGFLDEESQNPAIGKDANDESQQEQKSGRKNREEMVSFISSLSSCKQLGLDPDKVMEICDKVSSMVRETALAF